MESIELRSGAQSLCVLREQLLSSSRTVHNHNWDVAQLDLVDWTPFLRPLPVCLCSVDSDLWDVSSWSLHARNTGLSANELIVEDVCDWDEDDDYSACVERVEDGEVDSLLGEAGDGHDEYRCSSELEVFSLGLSEVFVALNLMKSRDS